MLLFLLLAAGQLAVFRVEHERAAGGQVAAQDLWKASGSYEQNHQKGGGRRRSAGRGTVRVRGVAPAITREILKRHGARFGVES